MQKNVKARILHNSEDQESALKNNKTFYNPLEKVIKLFDSYSTILSEAKHASFHGKKRQILIPKQTV